MIDFNVAFDKLAQFEKAEDIRIFLQENEIQARPAIARRCAISQYVRKVTGNMAVTSYHDVSVFENQDNYMQWNPTGSRKITPAMKEFIANFDQYEYPELIDPEDRGR